MPARKNPVTISRGNVVNVIFKNRDPEKRRLTVNMGEFEEDINGTTVKTATEGLHHARSRKDGRQFLSFMTAEAVALPVPQPYSFTVPGVEAPRSRSRSPE